MGGAAQLREQVFAVLLAPDRNLLREILDDALAALDAARHLGAGPWRADRGDGGGDHVDKGAGDLVDLGAEASAEERRGGQIERELLHRWIEQDRPRLCAPLRHP